MWATADKLRANMDAAEQVEDNGEDFATKIQQLTEKLGEQMARVAGNLTSEPEPFRRSQALGESLGE